MKKCLIIFLSLSFIPSLLIARFAAADTFVLRGESPEIVARSEFENRPVQGNFPAIVDSEDEEETVNMVAMPQTVEYRAMPLAPAPMIAVIPQTVEYRAMPLAAPTIAVIPQTVEYRAMPLAPATTEGEGIAEDSGEVGHAPAGVPSVDRDGVVRVSDSGLRIDRDRTTVVSAATDDLAQIGVGDETEAQNSAFDMRGNGALGGCSLQAGSAGTGTQCLPAVLFTILFSLPAIFAKKFKIFA